MSMHRAQAIANGRWSPERFASNPLLADLERLFQPCRWADWPDFDTLSDGLGGRLATDPAQVPRFVLQPAGQALPALAYEQHVTRRQEVRTRQRNWHDLFNALAWWLFPRTRRWLSAAHLSGAAESGSGRRTPRRDALTLFDECGVVLPVAAGSPLPALHEAHRWQDLFVTHRALWGRQAGAMILGHGLYEQCLTPYCGLTGKALWLTVDATVFDLPLAQRYRVVDTELAARLAAGGGLHSPRELRPLPVLGVPGWWPANAHAGFYANAAYFRPLRSRADG